MGGAMPPTLTALGRRLRAAFAGPRVIAWATAFAALLSIPVLFQGFAADDHTLRGILLRIHPWAETAKPPLELFSFYDGDPARARWYVDNGFSPWWTDPTLRLMFFRPLSAFTHWVDFHLWPGSPAVMHALSVSWYLGLVAAAGVLYRRVLGPGWVAGFAAFLFACDHNHGLLIEWISNRNALVAGAPAVAALVLHDRARREGRALVGLLSAACLGLGLLGGEVALGAVAYLVAHALFLDEGRPRARLAGLAPHLVVLLAWLVAYRVGGFGVRGSGLYVDPAQSPLAFARVAFEHVPLLLQTELGGFPPDILVFISDPSPLIYVAATAFLAFVLLAFWPLRRDARARFFFVGALLATLPAVATFPAGRLMLLPSLGLLGLVALVVEGVVDRTLAWRPGPQRWAALFVAVWVGAGHLLLSPLVLEVSAQQMQMMERTVAHYGDQLSDDPALARQRVVVVNSPDAFFVSGIIAQRITAGRVAPDKLTVLASGTRGLSIERRDARTLVVRQDGGFYHTGTELLTHSTRTPTPVGTRVALTDLTVEVTRTDAIGVPTEATFQFAKPLEDASLRWVEWRGRDFAPFALPAAGETRRIEGQMPSF
jgi:hypothetical protein